MKYCMTVFTNLRYQTFKQRINIMRLISCKDNVKFKDREVEIMENR